MAARWCSTLQFRYGRILAEDAGHQRESGRDRRRCALLACISGAGTVSPGTTRSAVEIRTPQSGPCAHAALRCGPWASPDRPRRRLGDRLAAREVAGRSARPSPRPRRMSSSSRLPIVDRSSSSIAPSFRRLHGVNIVPLHGDRAFLALDDGHGMTDLELAVIDSLEDDTLEPRERTALQALRVRLKACAASSSVFPHSVDHRRRRVPAPSRTAAANGR